MKDFNLKKSELEGLLVTIQSQPRVTSNIPTLVQAEATVYLALAVLELIDHQKQRT